MSLTELQFGNTWTSMGTFTANELIEQPNNESPSLRWAFYGSWQRSTARICCCAPAVHHWLTELLSYVPLYIKKVKIDHTRLPSVGFRSWSRFLAISLQVTWVINPAVGCHYCPPGPQLPLQPLRGLLPISLVSEQRHDGCEQFAKDCYSTASRLRFEPWPFCAWLQHTKHSATEPTSTLHNVSPSPSLGLVWKKLNVTQQMHAPTDQKKCNTTQNKHKKTRFSGLLRHLAWKVETVWVYFRRKR